MPSIANQDFKIYGLLDAKNIVGVRGNYCGEFYAALARRNTLWDDAQIADCFVFVGTNDGIVRMIGPTVYYDYEGEQFVNVVLGHEEHPAYYDALWAIQQAAYPLGEVLSEPKFDIVDNGNLRESSCGIFFVNEDGYVIKGTVDGDGKLASLYLGEKAEYGDAYAIVRLESLLPLVGELPLNTAEIW